SDIWAASINVQNTVASSYPGTRPAPEGRNGGVVFASMTTHGPASLQLHRATFKVAAVSFWGLATIVMATNYLGSNLQVNYPTEWVVTVIACASGVLFTAILAAAAPLAIQGWDSFYARTVVLLAASMVICAYIPALVRKALRAENQLAEQRRLELEQSYLTTIEALAATLDAKDRHTEAHSRETAALARAVGRRLGLDEDRLRFLEYGALLHDIGKIGIPGYVLNKPGPLDEEETAIMREHPVIGERIVASVPFLNRIRPMVRAEHERWDGGGYPDGLEGEHIPVE